MIKKYVEFIKEADETFEKDSQKFIEVKNEIK